MMRDEYQGRRLAGYAGLMPVLRVALACAIAGSVVYLAYGHGIAETTLSPALSLFICGVAVLGLLGRSRRIRVGSDRDQAV